MRLMTHIRSKQGTTRKYDAGLERGQQDDLAASLSRENDLLINATEDGHGFPQPTALCCYSVILPRPCGLVAHIATRCVVR